MDKTKVLVVIDMQNDFITGSLGSADAQAIVPGVAQLIESWEGLVYATKDTHKDNYAETLEGAKLPIPHCIAGTVGWDFAPAVQSALDKHALRPGTLGDWSEVHKPSFGSYDLIRQVASDFRSTGTPASITIVGLCTDICVVSNALMLRAKFPNTPITCIAHLCAGTSKENHEAALQVMRCCQIDVEY